MITQESIEKVKDAADIVGVVGDVVELKKAGATFTGLCPFHNENTPSFRVNQAKNFFKCFGCGKSGDAIGFIQAYKNLSFIDSIKYLAGKYNIFLDYDSLHTVEEEDEGKKADKALSISNEYFLQSIKKSEPAQQYLYDRKYNDELIAHWELGYAPMVWSGITPKLIESNLFETSIKLGLVKRNEEKQRNYDGYRNRITIPIRNHYGRLLGFGGRILPDQSVDQTNDAKYINPPDSKFYHKDKLLFGLNKARKAISENEFAILVEGYFDVISLHGVGVENAVASCGTAFTINQAKLLKKYCNHLVIAFDSDAPGIKATNTAIEIALAEGFKVDVFFTQEKDADEWIRTLLCNQPVFPVMQSILDKLQDAITWVCERLMEKTGDDAHKVNRATDQIAGLLSLIPIDGIRDTTQKKIVKSFKIRASDLKIKVTEACEKRQEQLQKEERKKQTQAGVPEEYTLPTEVAAKAAWNDIKKDVETYALFMFDNRCYSRRGEGTHYYFKEVANFRIRIIQHMEDERNPMKLAEVENVFGRKRTFDARSEDFTNQDSFNKMVTKYGNFNWQGERTDYQRLITKLYDEMGDGRIIHIMGWQDESFFAFCNVIAFTDGTIKEVDQYGCFTINGASYYVPAGNSIHATNPNFLFHQKRVVYQPTPIPFTKFLQQLKLVHREHAMNAILFTISSLFSDIIFEKVSFFPMLFLYGDASSGKDNLIECCQAFFGKSQSALTITGRANTDKAKIRKFAQMRNMIVHMSEYKNGSEDTDLLLMGLWDRRGYERANMDSGVGTEAVPILSSVVFTGNEYPTYDPLITRFVAEEMNVTEFSDAQKTEYEKLKEMLQSGISAYTVELLKLRQAFESSFRLRFKEISQEIKSDLSSLNLADRMISNTAVFGATLKLCIENNIPLPFDYITWKKYMVQTSLERQSNKRQTGSALSKWWDCFLDGCRTGKELIAGRDYRIDGCSLYINFKSSYNSYAVTHFKLFRAPGLSKAVMMDKLKKDETIFKKEHSSVRFGQSKSSAYEFEIDKIGIKEDLVGIMEHLEMDRTRYTKGKIEPEDKSEIAGFHQPYQDQLVENILDFAGAEKDPPF
jgi:DNA primase